MSIEELCEAEFDHEDDYKNKIVQGQKYLYGHYLEKLSRTPKGLMSYYVYEQKNIFFFPESIIYPFVPFNELKKGKKIIYQIREDDYTEIILFVQETNMSTLSHWNIIIFLYFKTLVFVNIATLMEHLFHLLVIFHLLFLGNSLYFSIFISMCLFRQLRWYWSPVKWT